MTKTRAFPLVRTTGERGISTSTATIHCSRCPNEITYTSVQYDGEVVKKLKRDRWWIGKNRQSDLCPVCAGLPSAEDRPMKPIRPMPVNAPRPPERRPTLSMGGAIFDHRAAAEQLFAPKPKTQPEPAVEVASVPMPSAPPPTPEPQTPPVGTAVDNTTLELILVALDELRNESEVRNKVIHSIVEGQRQQKAATEQLINAVAQIVPAIARSNDSLFHRIDRLVNSMGDLVDHLKTSTAPAATAGEPDIVVSSEQMFNRLTGKDEEEELPIEEGPFNRADMMKPAALNPDLFNPPAPEPDPEPPLPTTTLPDLLLKKRQERNFSVSELARKIGVTPQSVANWEIGRNTPGPSNLVKIAEALGIYIHDPEYAHIFNTEKLMMMGVIPTEIPTKLREPVGIEKHLIIRPYDIDIKGGAPCLISRGPGGYGSNIRVNREIWTKAGMTPDTPVRVELDEEDGASITIVPAGGQPFDCIPKSTSRSVTIRPTKINMMEDRVFPAIQVLDTGGLRLLAA